MLCNTGGLTEIPIKSLPATVEHLALTKNHFPVIKSDAFAGLRALRKLSLDGNNITTIKPFAFRGLPRLRELSIQHTPITSVAQFAFAGLQVRFTLPASPLSRAKMSLYVSEYRFFRLIHDIQMLHHPKLVKVNESFFNKCVNKINIIHKKKTL